MEIKLDKHIIEQMIKRGTNENEIMEVLNEAVECDAKYDRKRKSKIFHYNTFWCGKYYRQKKVEVIYKYEGNQIITITVYVYYGEWK